ncbi:hypothetical protein ACB092_11G093700 [Castanea dentata]
MGEPYDVRGNRSGPPSSFPPRSNLGKRKVGDIAQPSIESVLAGKEKKLEVDMAVARWIYYQPMLNVVAFYGPGYRGPNYLDGWIDTRHRTLINFLVYCPKGIDAINLIGPANIIHLVTDNVANYVAIGRILCGKYRNISWSPCAAHCLNLIFKEIGKMDHVAKLAKLASKITVFIYNHVALQAWLRTRKNWTEIVRPGPTRFATTFIALGTLIPMDYVYDVMYRDKKRPWEPYVNIIKDRWNNQFYRDIHAAAYWLNPAFQYDSSTLNKRLETQSAVTDVIESKVSVGRLKLVEELRLFREYEWWKLFGSCAPTLQKIAIRILSQIAASSGCEQNWSVFQKIHSKIRNSVEHQRLNDLVYVHYNYRLKEIKRKKFNFDPIDYTSIDKTEFWVVEDEEPPFLDHEEIDNMMLLSNLEIKTILFLLKTKKMRMRMMIMMLVVEHWIHMMILISIFFITNEA